MAVHVIKRGLDLPIQGPPSSTIEPGATVSRVALVAHDYPFMKPRMHVTVGDTVKRGQRLFEDRKAEGVVFTAPAAGTVVAIHRGERRAFQSLVIELSESEKANSPKKGELQSFSSHTGKHPRDLSAEKVRALLVESGLWTAIRKRPYSQVPSPSSSCRSIFVNAMDTCPLSGDQAVILRGSEEDLKRGMHAVSQLTEGKVFFVRAPGSGIDPGDAPRVQIEEFKGPHPAGLTGTHIHFLDPVGRARIVWYLSAQDVVAIGRLFKTGVLNVERLVALAGPVVNNPRILNTRIGAEIAPLVSGQLKAGDNRIISGSIFHGHQAQCEIFGFLGRYHQQVAALVEDPERVFMGWLKPGGNRFSLVRAFAAGLMGKKKGHKFGTSTHGSDRAMVPIGMFEKVMPLDIMPTFLLRALVMDDLERAEALGCMELDEEDLALCTFASPGKADFGVALRRVLTTIWKEG